MKSPEKLLKPLWYSNLVFQKVGKQLLDYVKEKKIRYKWLTEIEFVEQIPKSPSGKILRRVLKDRVKEGKVGVVVKEVVKAKL
jgi:4-coumarate--CoA ligase